MRTFTAPFLVRVLATLHSAQVTAALVEPDLSSTDVAAPADTEMQRIDIKVDCNELLKQVLEGVSAYPQYSSQAVAVGKKAGPSAFTAWAACKTFRVEAIDCNYLAGSIAGAITTAITWGFIDLKDEGAEAVNPGRAAVINDKLHLELQGQLEGLHVAYDFIDIDVQNSTTLTGRTALAHHAEIRGARFPDAPIADYSLLTSAEGGGYVRATPLVSGPIGRRAGGGGFKVSFEVFNRSGSPSPGAASPFGKVIASDWSNRVASQHDIGDYIGVVDFGYLGYIQLRIIPESGTVDNAFESVEVCAA
ncbi:uncharacterized protein B0I36DRAFT_381377 [Microdochium trichocladiopsis]|uniref:Uncharacterized protein n=1 Tax=Microdochium trichocladiopsis TaxID=1682393 RepID=A0A9P9BYT5_9PEZI|nr:uncharacterized protein B0I36DRAFT_381377 [Microdochium trichocladiopsis]KAH7038353.1 hypothetical protein B0I36DRAFT_381377 [Microdochium trichocladiopsis]